MGFRGCLHSVCQRASILDEEGVIHFFEKDKGPNLYTGPWALYDDVDTSEEK